MSVTYIDSEIQNALSRYCNQKVRVHVTASSTPQSERLEMTLNLIALMIAYLLVLLFCSRMEFYLSTNMIRLLIYVATAVALMLVIYFGKLLEKTSIDNGVTFMGRLVPMFQNAYIIIDIMKKQ
jgi:hypothetical protein